MADKKIMYRKTMLKNIYGLSKVFDEVMDYETYKKCIINNLENDYKYFNYLNGIKKCYYYILFSTEGLEDSLVLNILYNLLTKENINSDFNKCFDKENLLNSIINVLERINIEDVNLKYVYSFVVINYVIYIFKKKLYRFSKEFFKKFYKNIKESDYEEIEKLISIELEKSITPDENYYDNLEELKPDLIKETLISKGKLIKETFKMTSLYLYGSFSKDSYRIDSDIDIACIFEEDMSYQQKSELAYKFKQYILKTFKRYGDVMEFNEQILKGQHYIKLF